MLNAKQTAMINHMYTPKFLATLDDQGRPNLVIVTSFEFYRDQLIMGNLFLWKTARNLQQNPQLALLVIDQSLNYFTIEGRFTGFAETGELFDHLNRGDMVRYNAYTGFRSVGTVEMEAVSPVGKLNPGGMLWAYLKGKAVRSEPPRFPRAVAEKFGVLKSIKVAAYYSAGRFQLVLLPAVRVSGDYLVAAAALPLGTAYAANVITPEVVSFQVKGTVEEKGLKVEQIFAAGLPVPGKLIYQA